MNSISIKPPMVTQRKKHTYWFLLLLIPLLLFSVGMITDYGWQEEIMDWTGFALTLFCVLGRSYCTLFIGGIKNETVVRDGPYSVVRNPLYFFSFIGVVGIGLQTSRISLFVIFITVFLLYYRKIIKREEAYLSNKFGSDYQRYLSEVPRCIPDWSLWSEPKEVIVRPKLVRQTAYDALIFLIPWPIMEIIVYAHQHGLPALVLP